MAKLKICRYRFSGKYRPRNREKIGSVKLTFVPCPFEGSILTAYGGHFSNVHIVLHPFLRPNSISADQFRPETYPTKFQIVNDCEPVTWAEVVEQSDFDNIGQLDVALRCSISGIVKSKHRKDLVELLQETTERLGIVQPSEGDIAPHVELEIWNGLKKAGFQTVKIADEFGDLIEEHTIDGLFEKDCIPPHGIIFSEDLDFHIASHWDSHCTFMALNIPVDVSKLEKFKCNEHTEIYWGLYPEGNP
ncbi:DUF2711 family protein [Tritonibacter mobilis]|uniref:DUF2711 family protein n=1 Tax=Tritonibacter mobilis TaxID=379347 RepID=UPI000806B35B|nr:DUF2711 family protein [Tritonibacter mobilis]